MRPACRVASKVMRESPARTMAGCHHTFPVACPMVRVTAGTKPETTAAIE
jgi:hypothetical protein